jgi:hypothetical protein
MPNRTPVLDSLVPPASLAALLVAARGKSHLSLEQMEAKSRGYFCVADLVQIEAGILTLNDSQLRGIARLYGVDIATVAPGRSQLIIDRNEGKILMGDTKGKFLPDDDDHQIMMRYLALVYKMRDQKPGVELGPRDNDLDVLATVFGCSTEAVHDELVRLMRTSGPEIRALHGSLRWRVAVPALGVLVAITAVGGLILARHHNEPAIGATRAATAVALHRPVIIDAITITNPNLNRTPTGPISASLRVPSAGASSDRQAGSEHLNQTPTGPISASLRVPSAGASSDRQAGSEHLNQTHTAPVIVDALTISAQPETTPTIEHSGPVIIDAITITNP